MGTCAEGTEEGAEVAMPWMNVSCPTCGKTASIEAWTERPITGQLPPGQFQCPSCNYAFRREESGKTTVWTAPNGNRIAFREKIELRPCSAVM